MDSWLIEDDDLFCRKIGSDSHHLDELVERSLEGSPASVELQLEELAAMPLLDANSFNENVQVIPCDGAAAAAAGRRRAPKILKKKGSLAGRPKLNDTFKNIKKVTFEIEKLVADEAYTAEERDDAKARIALRLGAAPAPRAFVNYKQLKEERATTAATEAAEPKRDLKPLLKRKHAAKKSKKATEKKARAD